MKKEKPKLHPAASVKCHALLESRTPLTCRIDISDFFLHGHCCLLHWLCFEVFDVFLSVKREIYGINILTLQQVGG